MTNIDIARALKDKNYFNSLTDEQKAKVRQANPAGEPNLSDADLDTVSGGLGGGEGTEATTTTSEGTCSCSGWVEPGGEQTSGCICSASGTGC
ncbi:MAG TPA: mersacidin/lichenicidin family type 2 lantibiotic [Thermoanaerobaculia bacterium]|nr:mersacidin/lichenicidin family type 2 lantibiotic [Thermoanaerobaculia bacterium]